MSTSHVKHTNRTTASCTEVRYHTPGSKFTVYSQDSLYNTTSPFRTAAPAGNLVAHGGAPNDYSSRPRQSVLLSPLTCSNSPSHRRRGAPLAAQLSVRHLVYCGSRSLHRNLTPYDASESDPYQAQRVPELSAYVALDAIRARTSSVGSGMRSVNH
ncbi:hypothetical protein OH77DRAFT_645204 [Trametes cingulata]|nr:hypothetical protein OH77DRAFT_645204 [Trametes cingulata]